MEQFIGEAVYRFEATFRRDLGLEGVEPRWVGLENEYVMVNGDGTMVCWEVVEELWRAMVELGWQEQRDDITGMVVGVKCARDTQSERAYAYDVITTECGYGTIEIALAPTRSLGEGELRLREIVAVMVGILAPYGVSLLGYGVQPVVGPRHEYQAPKGRYELLYQIYLDECGERGGMYSPDLHCLNAASQVQVEVGVEEAIEVVNALNLTSGLRIALLANSGVWLNGVAEWKAVRQRFWDWCWSERAEQFGMPVPFKSIEQYVEYLFGFRGLVVPRGGTLYRIDNKRAVRQLYDDGPQVIGVDFAGREMAIVGSVEEDVIMQSRFAWFDVRLQPLYGTVEDRVACQQPAGEELCAAALTLGLVENYEKLGKIVGMLAYEQWREVRLRACRDGLAFEYPGVDVWELVGRMLEIAEEGLRKRGLGEEKYMGPLYERWRKKRCPADEMREVFEREGVGALIEACDMRKCGGI